MTNRQFALLSKKLIVSPLAVSTAITLSACGGGGSSSSGSNQNGNDSSQDTVVSSEITFPADNINLSGANYITVSGKVSVGNGSEPITNHGANISVNGVVAEFQSASSPYWSANIPVEFGDSEITVNLTKADGTTEIDTINLQNTPDLSNTKATAFDPATNTIFFAANKPLNFYSLNLDSQIVSKLYSENSEENTDSILVKAMAFNSSNNQLIVVDGENDRLIGINTETGQREIIAEEVAEGTWREETNADLAIDNARNIAYVATRSAIYPVDLTTGNSNGSLHTGHLNTFQGINIAYDATSNGLVIVQVDESIANIRFFDLNEHTTEVLQSQFQAGWADSEWNSITSIGNNQYFICNYARGSFLFNVQTNELSSLNFTTEDPSLDSCATHDFEYDINQNRLLATSVNEDDGLIAWDLETNTTSSIYSNISTAGSGDLIDRNTYDIAVDSDNHRAYTITEVGNLFSINLQNGETTKILENISNTEDYEGRNNYSVYGLEYSNNQLIVKAAGGISKEDIFLSIDIESNTIESLYSSEQFEANYAHPAYLYDYTYDVENNRVLFSGSKDGNHDIINLNWLDLETGMIEELRSDTYGFNEEQEFQPIELHALSNIDVDNNRVITGDKNNGIIKSIDINTGEVTTIVREDDPRTRVIHSVSSLAADFDNNRVLILDETQESLYWVDITNGAITLINTNGIDLNDSRTVSVDFDKQVAYIIKRGGVIVSVDLNSGNSAVLSKQR